MSRFTISRHLKANGYLKFVPRKIPLLTERHKLLRVNWAMKHRKTDWTKVVFTDESCIQFFSNKLKIWAKKRPSVMVPKWSPKIMVWGGISVRGTTFGFDVGTVNSQVYQKILNEHLQSIHELYPDNFTLQQDNARPHVSKDTLAYFKNNAILVIDWPPNSPHLNPIENIWSIMKVRLEKSNQKRIWEWKLQLEKIWEELDHQLLESLIISMPKRLEMVIKAK